MKKILFAVSAVLLLSGTAPPVRSGQDPETSSGGDETAESAAAITEYSGSVPEEVVIRGGGSRPLTTSKPAFKMAVDGFESIRASLEPDARLFLAESPSSLGWSRNRPDILHNPRVIQPWRTTFSDRTGITFNPRKRLDEIFRGGIGEKDMKDLHWALNIADEEGRIFQKYSGTGEPPEELTWSGQNDRNEWIKAGHSYSAVYMFTDAAGSPHTGAGNPLKFTGIVHQESSGLHISLDSAVLFGPGKSGTSIEKPVGTNLVVSAADLIKRKFFNLPVKVHSYARTRLLAEQQTDLVTDFLKEHLMILSTMISGEGHEASFSEQRVDIVLLNR
ncbi:MAG: hypothetical protein ABIG11_03655 [bacterium]